MLKELPIVQLAPSPTNPRKTFDETKLDELARSIRQHGILEPLLVRPMPAKYPVHDGVESRPPWDPKKVTHEIVAGERRYRGGLRAEIETAPCIVKDLTDVEVLEIQVIENLQRDDLHPLEEADGYARLIKDAAYDVARIAERVGRSEKYVYDRVKLLQLIPELRDVFLGGEITAGHAILLARLSVADQKRASSSDWSGLWTVEHADSTLFAEGQRHRKAVSVRELQTWIDHNVRFRAAEVDLPNLFPETEYRLERAAEEDLKVVHITHEYRVPDAAKDKTRTYGNAHWKRADGESWRGQGGYGKEVTSKTCEHSVLGVVVAGPGRGESFLVCVDKKKCTVHWKEEQAGKKRASSGSAAKTDSSELNRRWEERHKREEAERERWVKARPALLEALAEKVREASADDLVGLVVEHVAPKGRRDRELEKYVARGTSIEDAVRYCAFVIVSDSITGRWWAPERAPKALKPFGISAKQIVNKVAPKPRKKAAKKAAAKKKPGARARRRAKETAQTSANTTEEAS